ncbi:MAG TPA: PASTA domain-containing protein [Gaiellaceae bacterium]|jgi:hypothetical protein
MKHCSAIAMALAACVLLLAGASSASTTHAHLRWGQGVPAALPADAAIGAAAAATIEAVSCSSPGNCSAVGGYVDGDEVARGLLLTETAGKWARGVEAVLPANADPTSHGPFLESISCSSPGNCAAIGGYTDNAGHLQGLLLTETAGVWGPGVEAALPANAIPDNQLVLLGSVSCPADGECVAVGAYNVNSDTHALVLTETAGTWATGAELATPGDAPVLAASSVSCPAVGKCTAVGEYINDGGNSLPVMWTESTGVWEAGVAAALPANLSSAPGYEAYLGSVSCASAGNCTAVGEYNEGPYWGDGLLLTEKAGTWGKGVEAIPPSGVKEGAVQLTAVSCASARSCTVLGDYDDRSLSYAFALSKKRGVWSRGVVPPLARDAQLDSVSCASPGDCSVVGNDIFNGRPVLLDETAGTWKARFASLPSGTHGGGLNAVSCASANYCAAVGKYTTRSHASGGLLLDGSPTPPCVVPELGHRTLRAARKIITSANCSVGAVRYARSRKVKSGHVISQRPRPDKRLKYDARIDLVVSAGR